MKKTKIYEMETVKRNLGLPKGLLSDSHRYTSEKGEISLLSPCYATFNKYEIYCIDGDLFEDVERYDILEYAEKRITELLQSK